MAFAFHCHQFRTIPRGCVRSSTREGLCFQHPTPNNRGPTRSQLRPGRVGPLVVSGLSSLKGVSDMSVQKPSPCATLCGMNDRHGRARLEQIRILMEEMEAQLDRDWPLVPVERAAGTQS
ncbi:hypothetical protein GCM10008959_26290 [Deinococcus seoulensis]|uniref:Uncharacterized protein n=1 Tax=Deinococcus seoulensis TaxID=1837379 RepID=A0ABQ2RSI8_9DEIO|nr:hypothetical protein GCM10008959_26290 [Deinococcus seoulensis]